MSSIHRCFAPNAKNNSNRSRKNVRNQQHRGACDSVTIDRRVTQGVRGDWGRRFMERLWTVLATCEKQKRDVLNDLESCLRAFWLDVSPPALVTAE